MAKMQRPGCRCNAMTHKTNPRLTMKKTLPFLLIIFAGLLLADSALALDAEFYTYGGFNPIVQAFNRIALIFSDSGYGGLLFVMAVMGFLGGAAAWIATAATGVKIVPLVWTVPVIVGAAVWMAFFVPKGTVTIYDPVLNRFQAIGDVPDGVVLVAGSLNKIERAIVDIIDTAAAPDAHYTQTAGGIGFKALESVKDSAPKDSYARNSMIRYIKDCVSFELVRPGTTLSLDNLRNTSTDFLNELALAVNPAVFTVYYDSANPAGTSMSCTASWANLQPIYNNPANYDEALRKMCSKTYFDSSNAAEMTTCRNLLTSTMNFTTGIAAVPEKLIQQRQIAEILYNFYYQDDYETAIRMESDRKITSSGIGLGITMNEWIPIIRAVLTAVAIGIIPFLVLFIPTPILGKAVSLMVGFFVFLATWGVTDAVIHGAAMDYAASHFEDMRQSSLGVYAMAAFPTDATKILSMFGVIRSAGIMLASMFSMMLIKFGGSALAHLATNLSGLVQSAGSQAGSLLTPEGNSEAMNRQLQAAGLLDGMKEHRFSNMAAASAWGLHKSVGSHGAAMDLKSSLGRTGKIGKGTTDGDFAQMMASSNQSVATANGTTDATIGPDGNIVNMNEKSITPHNFSQSVVTGKDGSGMATLSGAAGKLEYGTDKNGNWGLNNAQVNGMDPVKVGKMLVDQKTHAAAHNLASSSAWEKMWSEASRTGSSDATNQSMMNQVSSSTNESLRREVAEGSGWAKEANHQERADVQAALSAGGRLVVGANGSEGVTAQYGNGTSRKLNLSENTATSLANSVSRADTESLGNVLSTTQGRDWVSGLAQRTGNTDTSSTLDEIRNIDRSQASYGVNAMSALVDNHAKVRFGGNSPEHHQMAVNDLNDLATRRGSAGVQALNEEVSGFLSGKGYWGGGQPSASHGGGGVRGEVEQAAARAADRTADVGNFSLQKPHHEPIVGPSEGSFASPPGASETTQRADNVRRGHIEAVGKSDSEGAGVQLKRAEAETLNMMGERRREAEKDFMDKSVLDKPLNSDPPKGSYGNQGIYSK